MADEYSSQSFRYHRVFANSDGESHVEICEVPMSLREYAPPAPALLVSAPLPGSGIVFITFPPRWVGDWHPVPRRQWMFALTDGMEAELSDGTVLRDPSAAYLLEDTWGRGHRSRNPTDQPIVVVVVPIPD